MFSDLCEWAKKEFRETRLWSAYGYARSLLDREYFSRHFYAYVDDEKCYLESGEGGKFVFSYWENEDELVVLKYPLNEFVKDPKEIVSRIRLKVIFS